MKGNPSKDTGRSNDKKREEQPFRQRSIEGFDQIINELSTHTRTSSIATFVFGDNSTETWDINRKNTKVSFGTTPEHDMAFKPHILAKLVNRKTMAISLRSFTEVRDRETNLPIKELRAYYITSRITGDRVKLDMHMLSAEDVYEAQNTDSVSGKPIGHEKAVIYCGPDYFCIDTEKKPVIMVGFKNRSQ